MTESRAEPARDFTVGGERVLPGQRKIVPIPIARLPATQIFLPLPVEVIQGVRPGPRLWLSAAIHGDELNGIEIIRRVRQELNPQRLAGTVLAVPIVNVFGFLNESRYLPDRRDLNRSFPGSSRGSLAGRLAATFMEEVVAKCDYGVDLHTGSDHRTNLPQVRADLRNPETRRCALALGTPICIHAHTRDGSLRDAAARLGKHALLYEAGEPLRFNQEAIQTGVEGIHALLGALGMVEAPAEPRPTPTIATRTTWIRARTSGLFRVGVQLGERVEKNAALGWIADAFGNLSVTLKAPGPGVVIGFKNNPMVRQGDGAVHMATEFGDPGDA